MTTAQDIRDQIATLQAQLNELEAAESAAKVQSAKEVFSHDWEVRTGHTTGSTNHREWQSDQGEPWTFVIVPIGTRQIVHISESSRSVDIEFAQESTREEFPDHWGHGETLDEAWEDLFESNP